MVGVRDAVPWAVSGMWILFTVPCPTPDGRSAEELYDQRAEWITPQMQASAAEHGCEFHRVWYARDGSALVVLGRWRSPEGAQAFYDEWQIGDEPGEVGTVLLGDLGLAPLP